MSTDIAPLQSLGRKILWRLGVPTILYMLFSSLDRVNISFAALQMNADLGFSPSQYGFGAGILFLGFLAGQYPSVLLMQRIGMRWWMCLSCLVWALSAAAIAAVHTPLQFYSLRILLGFAEGGLAPGIVVYLSQFTSERERATTFALPMLAIPLSLIIGSPISGWLMGIHAPPFGLSGWRWLLIAESLPTVLLGFIALKYFPDRAREARWLTAAELAFLEARPSAMSSARRNDWSVLRRPVVWCCALLWFALLSGAYGIMFWLPQTVKQLSNLSPLQIGFVNALPWTGAMFGTYFNSRHSDRTGERFLHIAVPAALAAVCILLAWSLSGGAWGIVVLFVAGAGLGAAQGAFWALPTSVLTPASFAVAAVAINIAGSSGGLVVPHLLGIVREQSGSFFAPTLLIAFMLALSALLTVVIQRLFFRGSGRN
jgi:ACS family tartrate transporter-like MFS transporter